MATAGIGYLLLLIAEGARYGLNRNDELRRLGIDPSLAKDPEARVEAGVIYEAWNRLAEASSDATIGLTLAQHTEFDSGVLGVVRHVCMHTETLRQAYQRLARYLRLVHSGIESALEENQEVGCLAYASPSGGENVYSQQWALATFFLSGRDITGENWRPHAVRFVHADPTDLATYDKLFGAPLIFGHARNELVVDQAVLDLPLAGADTALAEILERYVTKQLEALPKEETIVSQVRRTVIETLSSDASLPVVAKRLAMSSRTLQRRLGEAGTSHSEMIESVRREMAVGYVKSPHLSLGQVALLLGYSDMSAFSRAFRRWHGSPPASMRPH